MELNFRWYGESDSIPLKYIKQIPRITGIVSALHDVPVGEIWSIEKLALLKKRIESAGLNFSVVESIYVHEDIKLGRPNRDELIENYCQSIRNMGSLGIKILCYNFMPVFDWTRSDLVHQLSDGSTSLCYEHQKIKSINIEDELLDLPGWGTRYTQKELSPLLKAYEGIDEEALWSNLEYFLERVVPVAEESDVKMGIHPDDPPWSIFGLPRIITNEKSLDRLVKIVNSKYNGITLCSGSFGPNSEMDIVKVIRRFGKMKRIHFAHCRNIKRMGDNSFCEVQHPTEFGDVNMYEVIKAYVEVGFSGAIRPDHGRMIWDEHGRPGYGLYDRALGAVYLSGLWEGIEKSLKI
jgi:mannonate dehydratase